MILAGDIGGTKTNLGLFRPGNERPEEVRKDTYRSEEWDGLAPMVREFLGEDGGDVDAAAFGVAGPVEGDVVETPNLAWDVDARVVSEETGISRIGLLNDLEATAEGIPALRPDEMEVLHAGRESEEGNAALIAPGTGLGMCIVDRSGGGWQPMAGEGGHQTFAARNRDEEGLRRYLEKRFGHVSVERVVSGPGLVNVFDYLVEEVGLIPEDAVRERMAKLDRAVVISRAAMEGACSVCLRAHRMFVSAFGAAAGNLALVSLARNGVFLGGGIPPKIRPALRDGTFLEAFAAKGRFREFVARIPVRVLLNPETALIGAARRAARIRNG